MKAEGDAEVAAAGRHPYHAGDFKSGFRESNGIMLQFLRGSIGTFLVKVLFAVLLLSFGIWGIGDIFRGRGSNTAIAEVGREKITLPDLDQEFRRLLNRMRQRFGAQLDAEQARAMGLMESALEQMIQRALFDEAARDYGLKVGDDLVRLRLRQFGEFRNSQGQFDPELLRRSLASNSMSEQQFIELLRRDAGRDLLMGAVSSGATVPQVLVDTMVRYRQEKRVAEVVVLPHAAMPDPGTPTDADQAKFHEEGAVRFTTPEYRQLTLLQARLDDLAKTITPTDEDVQAAFTQRAQEFQIPERRAFLQVLLDNEDAAQKLAEEARKAGLSLEDAAKAAKLEVSSVEAVTEADLPDIGGAVFALPQGKIGDPIKSELGFHVVVVTDVRPGIARTLAEVKDVLLADLRKETAQDRMPGFVKQVEDAVASGATLAEVATRFALPLEHIPAVETGGTAPDGNKAAALAEQPAALQAAFTLPQGGHSPVVETGDGNIFIVQVDGITPSRLKPLEEVRAQIITEWQAQQRAKTAETRAAAAEAELAKGTAAEAVAAANGGTAATSEALARGPSPQSESAHIPGALLSRLFTLKPGEAAHGAGADQQVVVRLKEIVPADPKTAEASAALVREQLRQSLTGDILLSYTNALRTRYPVRVDETQLRNLLGSSN